MWWHRRKSESDTQGGRDTKERDELARTLAIIGARANCVEAIVVSLIRQLPTSDREQQIRLMRDLVVDMGDLKAPSYVPKEHHQKYRDELSRMMQVFMKIVEGK